MRLYMKHCQPCMCVNLKVKHNRPARVMECGSQSWNDRVLFKGYRMVFASICEHASSAFIFASTSSDQFSHASSEHFKNYKWRAVKHFVNFPPAGISLY